jgi:hypothetical protein
VSEEYRVWFTNLTGCAVGVNDVSWVVTVVAASEAEAVERAVEQARALDAASGLPPHGLRVGEAELRRLAYVLPRGSATA